MRPNVDTVCSCVQEEIETTCFALQERVDRLDAEVINKKGELLILPIYSQVRPVPSEPASAFRALPSASACMHAALCRTL